MNKKIPVIMVLAMLTLSGCATRGRLSVLDVDLRTPEQIIAYQPEAAVVYESEKPNLGAGIAAPIPWEFIIKLVEVVKGRVRVLSFEWKK